MGGYERVTPAGMGTGSEPMCDWARADEWNARRRGWNAARDELMVDEWVWVVK